MKRTLALAALCLLSVFAVPTAAIAATSAETSTSTYGPRGCATITPVSVMEGDTVTFSCNGTFDPTTPVDVVVDGPGCHLPAAATPTAEPTTAPKAQAAPAPAAVAPRTAAPFAAAADGAFAVQVQTSPTQSGTCTVTAEQVTAGGTTTETASFTVTERAFAETGFTGGTLAWIGGGLLVMGAAVFTIVAARRRQQV